MGREHATRPAGCTCPYVPIHMDMPWQRLSTDPECAVHSPVVEEKSTAIAEATSWQQGEWIG